MPKINPTDYLENDSVIKSKNSNNSFQKMSSGKKVKKMKKFKV